MGYNCSIIADSINENNSRLTTFEITFPRSILAEFNTHRQLSRSSASSRAIPIERMIAMVEQDPYIPVFTKNQAGMQGIDAEDDTTFQEYSTDIWLHARDNAVKSAKAMVEAGVHKQDANRLLEPFMWHTVIVTATNWANFFTLRVHLKAHPAIQKIATLMADAMVEHTPKFLKEGQWHLPYITETDENAAIEWLRNNHLAYNINQILLCMSTARCARTSYMRQDALKSIEEDIKLHDRLVGDNPKHSGPAEHQAQARVDIPYSGNFLGGWLQYRHTLLSESAHEFMWKGVHIR